MADAVFDHAQSPRLGQPTPVESTSVRMFSGSEIPEAAWRGQIIYRTDTQILQVFDGTAWEDVVGGIAGMLTFVGPNPPTSNAEGDLWFDTDDSYRLYRAAVAGANEVADGEWEPVSANVTQDYVDQAVNNGTTINGFQINGALYYGQITWDTTGITVGQNDGTTIFFPADGTDATITADLQAKTLESITFTALDGDTRLGGNLSLVNSVNNPTVAPAVGEVWFDTSYISDWYNHVNTGFLLTPPEARGMAVDPTDGSLWILAKDSVWKQVAGTWTKFTLPESTGGNPTSYDDIEVIGNIVWVSGMNPITGRKLYRGTWAALNFSSWTIYSNLVTSQGWQDKGYKAALYYDGTTLHWCGWVSISGSYSLKVCIINTSTGSISSVYKTLTGASAGDLAGMYIGNGDFAQKRIVLGQRNGDLITFVDSTGAKSTAADGSWPRAFGFTNAGVIFKDSTFYTMDFNGHGYQYNPNTSSTNGTYTFGYTWTDSGNTHTTTLSPTKSIVWHNRSWMSVGASRPPAYLLPGPNIPSYTSFYGKAGTSAPLIYLVSNEFNAWGFDTVPSGSTSTPVNNWSDVVTPGKLASTTGGFSIDGKGNGSVGTGSFATSVKQQAKSLSYMQRTKNANQTVSTGTSSSVNVTYGAAAGSVGSNITYNSTDGTFTVGEAGRYMVTAGVVWDNNGSGRRLMQVQLNGGQTFQSNVVPSSSAQCAHNVTAVYDCAVGDVINVQVNQNSGGDLDVLPSSRIAITQLC